jgi:hypothetical protein
VVGPRWHDDVHGSREHQLAVDRVQNPKHGRYELRTECYRCISRVENHLGTIPMLSLESLRKPQKGPADAWILTKN